MSFEDGESVEVRGMGGRVRFRGTIAIEVDDPDGTVFVVPAGKVKRKRVEASKIRRLSRRPAPAPRPIERPPVVGPSEFKPQPRPEPPARSSGYLAFVREHRCIDCGAKTSIESHHWAARGIGGGGGLGQKCTDFLTVPLCTTCHRHWHDAGRLPSFDSNPGGGKGKRRPVASIFMFMRSENELHVEWMGRLTRQLRALGVRLEDIGDLEVIDALERGR